MERLLARELKQLDDEILETHQKWSGDDGFANQLITYTKNNNIPFDLSVEEIVNNMTLKGYATRVATIRKKYEEYSLGPSHKWIGINPPSNSITLPDLYDKFQQFIQKHKYFSHGYLYCLEQHTDNGIRPHIHLMLLCRTKNHRIIDQLSKFFNIKSNFIECKTYHHGYLYEEHKKYIEGDKKKEKQENVFKDNDFLASNNIPKYLGEL